MKGIKEIEIIMVKIIMMITKIIIERIQKTIFGNKYLKKKMKEKKLIKKIKI